MKSPNINICTKQGSFDRDFKFFDISLVLIDGGLNHLKFIEGALKKMECKFASIGKGEKRKTFRLGALGIQQNFPG